MYMRESRKEVPVSRVPVALGLALISCVAATVFLGVFPDRVLQYAQNSARQMVGQPRANTPVSALHYPF
jgi:hypothetical protein